eukprot:scaffold586663_cov39-Prasinocladus_malaysianus.AAC.1
MAIDATMIVSAITMETTEVTFYDSVHDGIIIVEMMAMMTVIDLLMMVLIGPQYVAEADSP